MIKTKIDTIQERNRITGKIINTIIQRNNFLICGHLNPDEDCISSMTAFAILLTKFDKSVQIYIDGYVNKNLDYLLKICRFNSIRIINSKSNIKKGIDTIVLCDTAKKSMLDINSRIEKLLKSKDIVKIEIDHHIGRDSEYIGDPGSCLVDEASSASELVGFIALKLRNMKNILMEHFILDPFSRNFILAILTGIVGDTNMGLYLKSRREKKYYEIFSNMYNEMLMKLTVKETNLNRIEDVSNALHRLTIQEEQLYAYLVSKKQSSKLFSYIIVNKVEMEEINNKFDYDVFITDVKHVADELAEDSGKLSLIVYYDNHENADLYQFRMRRSFNYKKIDLRNVIEILNIADGGGHAGAIGFRFPSKDIEDIDQYTETVISEVEKGFK
ncbi:MAG: DHH family phosphoesterase [Spirochaetes bacterium]|nr:DHH family phosphoesterase [Spirochaetota bacterium]